MEVRKGLLYTESHEWVQVEGNKAMIGITDYAQESLGDIVYVETPEVGINITKGDEALNIESVKVAEAVYAPVSGNVDAVNNALEDEPQLINQNPYGTFIYSVAMNDSSELDSCMDAAAYKAFIDSQD